MLDLTIQTGNDAMSTAEDVAQAVASVASRIAAGFNRGGIIDANGNTVGFWNLSDVSK